MAKEIEIPEGYEARIEGNKVIIERKESEDERIRTRLIALVEAFGQGKYKDEMLAYLEKQKKAQPGDEDRYMVGYMNGMNDAMKEQKPAEWSERDERMLNECIRILEEPRESNSGWPVYISEINWLKSLSKPQNYD